MLGLHVSVVVRITLFISKGDPWPPISLLIVVIPYCLYSAHVKLGPCHWPSKGDWLLERREFCLQSLSWSVFWCGNPPSISVTVSQLAPSCWFLSDFLSSICFYYSLSTDSSLSNTLLQLLYLHISGFSLWVWYWVHEAHTVALILTIDAIE